MESAPCIESIFIFPKILAGKQKAVLSTSISHRNPIASVKDHNLSSSVQEWGQFLSGYFNNFAKQRLLRDGGHIQNNLQE